ncbi:hypothetical protein GKZ68_02280 [Hymenobacter sp. BRD128]|uniref:hypothetical protein n=1 Tax=Hymenobacter sp. BRD128 TaxID=2675878 RepID=UPI0015636614|nr:hypothetical protein [Hymenobacter sp. BRD128]QKG55565.1 hypothetical protein GKZ68_02280 [Hymenobacter sp. BRD128]
MTVLTYTIACKSCLVADDVQYSMQVANPYKDLLEDKLLKSDYKLVKYVMSNLSERNFKCPFCDSKNLDVNSIAIDNKRALIDNTVTQLRLVLVKNKNGEIEMKKDGSEYFPPGFSKRAYELMKKALMETPINEFEQKQTGLIKLIISSRYTNSELSWAARLKSVDSYLIQSRAAKR